MKVVDLNLLIYAVNEDAPQHARARRWWEATLNGDEQVGLAWAVVLGFLRLCIRSGVLPRPLAPKQALDLVQAWILHPLVVPLHAGDQHWVILRKLLEPTGMAGNLTTDAHLAALAIEYGGTLCSTDADFARFKSLKFENPLA